MFTKFRSFVVSVGLAAAFGLAGCASTSVVPLGGGNSPYGGATPVAMGAPAPVAYMPVAPDMGQQQQMPPQGGPALQPAPGQMQQQSFAPPQQQYQQPQPQQYAQGQMTRGQQGLQVCQQHVLNEAMIDAQNSGNQADQDKLARVLGGTAGAVGNGVWGSKKTDGLSRVGAGAGLGMLAGDAVTGIGQLIGGANKNAAAQKAFDAARAGNAGLVNDEPIGYYPGDDGRVYKVFWAGQLMQVAVNQP